MSKLDKNAKAFSNQILKLSYSPSPEKIKFLCQEYSESFMSLNDSEFKKFLNLVIKYTEMEMIKKVA